MPDGVIVGGWGFIIAAYSVVLGSLCVYAITLMIRLRRARQALGTEAAGDPAISPSGRDRVAGSDS